ncbi:Calcium-dependent lipid-binding (CaLB domain) family protein [Rhynchospora pubera]|uniref:Calcium-dependent lipid-binding (CaLB domain) family protein n=1 Tax=Rhynchospora pubera TaxID=906938 RepID=A0AAV8DVJ0_9POAL|nr:Calcium-dependent lipid-binding (CaLB domain) family protein [Rhynchospora pubera]KAJ4788771.1 Calcium-dependent lipid-binding (CaLB domain) family protein [Rhynchospora pubera]
MSLLEISIVHHIALVLVALWGLVSLGWSHPVVYFCALVYLYAVNEKYTDRLRRRLQYEERKSANQKRLLSDAETVRWLNHAVEKIWPICMERIASQQFLMPIVPWFLDKFKPWTAKKAVLQNLYLGRNPPIFTDIRVMRNSTDDDHLVLELGMNFLSGEDMNAVLSVQLRKRLGFGITANMHITGMHIEGKILVGVKFLRQWPFLGRVRVCFVEPPYFQMTVKPIFGHGLDVAELPGISGWLDKLLDIAFRQTLVEPNMLVVDVEKFVKEPTEGWFTVDEKPPVALVKLEILEGADMKPSDPNGLADPYVKGRLGAYRFQTKIQKKTLSPKWLEEFSIPITSWDSQNFLYLQVRDKDPIFDDLLGDCSVNIKELRGGQRHDKWISLKNIKMGRINIAITVQEDEGKVPMGCSTEEESGSPSETMRPYIPEDLKSGDENSVKMKDEFEPINIKGQDTTGIWVHHPGSEVCQTWEPRKGRIQTRIPEAQICKELNGESPRSLLSESLRSDSSNDESTEMNKNTKHSKIKKGLGKIKEVFHIGSPRKDRSSEAWTQELLPTPRSSNLRPEAWNQEQFPTPRPPNLRPVGEKTVSVNIVLDQDSRGETKENSISSPDYEESTVDVPIKNESDRADKGRFRQKLKHAGQHALRKLSDKRSDKNKEQQLGDDYVMDASSRHSDVTNEVAKGNPLIVGSSPISVQGLSSPKDDILLNKSEVQ